MKPFAFFFNAEHSSLGTFYGPPCTATILKALESYGEDINTRILHGDMLPHSLVYNISSISRVEGVKSKAVTTSYAPDMALYKLVLCDLADSLKAPLGVGPHILILRTSRP